MPPHRVNKEIERRDQTIKIRIDFESQTIKLLVAALR